MSAQPLRIMHLQPMTLDLYGHRDADLGRGVRYSLTNLAAAQRRAGDAPVVHLLASERPLALRFDGVEARFDRCFQPPARTGISGRFARQLSFAMLRAIRPGAADIVHFHGIRQFHPMFAAVAWRAQRAGLPLVGQDRGWRTVGRVETAAQRFGLRRCTAVLAASRDSAERLAPMLREQTLVDLAPNGVDPALFRPAGTRRDRGAGAFRVLVVSRLSAEKDPLTMARALAAVVRLPREVTLTIVSRGRLRGEVEGLLRAAGVDAHFIDHLPQAELAERYRASDALILTSRTEGWNQVVLEAMACGVPVIATDIPGTREAAGEAAMLVAAGDHEAVASALTTLIDDASLWNRQRDLGLRHAGAYTWDAVASRVRETYRACLERASSAVAPMREAA